MRVETILIKEGARSGERVLYPTRNGSAAHLPIRWLAASRNYRTLNSQRAMLQVISVIDVWNAIFNLDYEDQLTHGSLFSDEQIESLCYFLRFKKNDLDQILSLPKPITSNLDQIEQFMTCWAPVSNSAYAQRLTLSKEYFEWAGNHGTACLEQNYVVSKELIALRRLRCTEARHDNFQPMSFGRRFKNKIKKRYQPGSKSVASELDRFARYLENDFEPNIVWPHDSLVRLRNETMIKLMLSSGIRKGEMMKLKMHHVLAARQAIQIERQHLDSEDVRAQEPAAKTAGRIIPLDKSAFELLTLWMEARCDVEEDIIEYSSKEHNNNSSFIFVSLNRDRKKFGLPISASAVQKIFKCVRNAAGCNVRLHDLRHLAASRFAAIAHQNRLSDEVYRKYICELMGWSIQSKMPFHYSFGQNNDAVTNEWKKMWVSHGEEF